MFYFTISVLFYAGIVKHFSYALSFVPSVNSRAADESVIVTVFPNSIERLTTYTVSTAFCIPVTNEIDSRFNLFTSAECFQLPNRMDIFPSPPVSFQSLPIVKQEEEDSAKVLYTRTKRDGYMKKMCYLETIIDLNCRNERILVTVL